jgi:hypothetical protein
LDFSPLTSQAQKHIYETCHQTDSSDQGTENFAGYCDPMLTWQLKNSGVQKAHVRHMTWNHQ